MDLSVKCTICFSEYHEETCVPKVLKCGHSLCHKCLTAILQSQKSCAECRATLSKNLEEYVTNFDLLRLAKSLKEKRHLYFHDAGSLESITNELNSKKQILEKLMAERDSITGSLERNKASVESIKSFTQKLLNYTKIMFEADGIENLVQGIEDCLEKVNKSLNCSWETYKENLLRLKNFENSKLFLSEIARRLPGGKRIYACKKTNDLGEWMYGEITLSEGWIHFHSLSSGFEPGASLVLFKDVKDFISKRENVFPFIEVGNQKLCLTLTEDPSIDVLRCLKYFTGEEGHTMKGLSSVVDKYESENLDRCYIDLRNIKAFSSNINIFNQKFYCDVKKGELTLHCILTQLHITKWSKDGSFYNLLGRFHGNSQIDFNKMKLKNRITNCGISLQL